MASGEVVDYVKLRFEKDKKKDDQWWVDHFAGNNEQVGSSDEGYESKENALRAIHNMFGQIRVIDEDGNSVGIH